jgi:subtilisin family serine protease
MSRCSTFLSLCSLSLSALAMGCRPSDAERSAERSPVAVEAGGVETVFGLPAASGQVLVGAGAAALPEVLVSLEGDRFVRVRSLRQGEVGVYAVPAGLSVEAAIEALSASDELGSVSADLLLVTTGEAEALAEPDQANDTLRGSQWNMDTVAAEQAWQWSTGEGVVVAVIDSGVFAGGEDGITHLLPGWDFADGDADPSGPDAHGTHVAGTIGARSNNGVGVIGLAPDASILPVKVFADDSEGARISDIIAGIDYAVSEGADVINMSLGSPAGALLLFESKAVESELKPVLGVRALCAAVEDAAEAGVFVAVAAGNDGADRISYPAACRGAVSVAATSKSNALANFSNHGEGLAFSAPGKRILQEINVAGEYESLAGTSMASPHVAAAAALLMSAGADADDAYALLAATAVDLGDAGHDLSFGHGLIQPAAALEELSR